MAGGTEPVGTFSLLPAIPDFLSIFSASKQTCFFRRVADAVSLSRHTRVFESVQSIRVCQTNTSPRIFAFQTPLLRLLLQISSRISNVIPDLALSYVHRGEISMLSSPTRLPIEVVYPVACFPSGLVNCPKKLRDWRLINPANGG